MARAVPSWVREKGFTNWSDYMESIRNKRKGGKRRLKKIRIPKNPPAARLTNPIGQKLPATDIQVLYKRTSGEYAGELFKHSFGKTVEMLAMPNGTVVLRSRNGKKLFTTQ